MHKSVETQTVRHPQSIAEDLERALGPANELLREIAESYPGQVATLVPQAIAAGLDSVAQDVVVEMARWIETDRQPRPENLSARLGLSR